MVRKGKSSKRKNSLEKKEQGKQRGQDHEEAVSKNSEQEFENVNEEKDQTPCSRPRSGKMLRREPNAPVEFVMNSDCMEVFKRAQWLNYLKFLRGYHTEVALAFAKTFNGHEATIGVLKMYVSEVLIASLAELPLGGKRFSKKDKIDEKAANKFLKTEFHDPNWSQGIDIRCLKDEFVPWLKAIKSYITCDGRFNHMFRYQVWFLMHLAGDIKIDLPYFLLQSLTKMSMKVQKFPKLAESSLLHESLITMIVANALRCQKISFSEFLVKSNFSCQPVSTKRKMEKGESSKRVNKEETDKDGEALVAAVGLKAETVKPEIRVVYTRSTRAQSKKMHIHEKELVESDPKQVEEKEELPFVRKMHTRPTNKLRLKGKMLIDPRLKKTAVILVDSDVSSQEVHEQQTKSKNVKERLPVHDRKGKGKKQTVKSSSSKQKITKEKLPEEDLAILEEASCRFDDPSVLKPKKSKLSDGKSFSMVKGKVPKTEIRVSEKQSMMHKQKSGKAKKKLFEKDQIDEFLDGPRQMEVQEFFASAEVLASGAPKRHEDLQEKDKGKSLFIENLAEEIEQIETEEEAVKNEKNVTQKVREWMTVLEEEKSKGEKGQFARAYKRLVNMGHLAEELTWIMEKSMEAGTPAKIEEARDLMEAKRRKNHHV